MEVIYSYMPAKVCTMFTFLIICAIIAWIDIQKQTIYNEAVAALLVPAIASFFVFPEVGVVSRLLGAVSVSSIMLFICLIRPGAFGGGDIKLMVPIGLYLGLERTLTAGCLSVFIGAVWGIAVVLKSVWKEEAEAGKSKGAFGKSLHQMQIPLGPALCLGAVIAMLL